MSIAVYFLRNTAVKDNCEHYLHFLYLLLTQEACGFLLRPISVLFMSHNNLLYLSPQSNDTDHKGSAIIA